VGKKDGLMDRLKVKNSSTDAIALPDEKGRYFFYT
jgi:hypothetical protein